MSFDDTQSNSSLFQRGFEAITGTMRRVPQVDPTAASSNPLRDAFTDLIAYVMFCLGSPENTEESAEHFRSKVIELVEATNLKLGKNDRTNKFFPDAQFAVLCWVDESVLLSDRAARREWESLTLKYYGTNKGGEEFFSRLANLPPDANNVREIYFLCLCLGFRGKYASPSQQVALNTTKQQLYETLKKNLGDISVQYSKLFPEAYETAQPPRQQRAHSNWVWYSIAVAIPSLLFIVYLSLLWNKGRTLETQLQIVPQELVKPRNDWASSLVKDLREHGIPAIDEPSQVKITLKALRFSTGSSELDLAANKQLVVITTTINKWVPDTKISVEGHASSESGTSEPANLILSENRARAVANALAQIGIKNKTIATHGWGSRYPLENNAKGEEARASNRRVEILIQK